MTLAPDRAIGPPPRRSPAPQPALSVPQARLAAGHAVRRVPALVGARARPADLLHHGGRDGRDPVPPAHRCVVPRGFAIWLLFLVWMLAGVFVVRAVAPGTVPGVGIGRYGGFLVWAGWYFAITVAMLYVVNTARQVSTQRIVRLLGWMFVVTTGFGVLAVAGPHPGVQVGGRAGPAQGPDREQLRPHPGAPVAVVHQRLPRLRAGPPDGAVPLLQRVGQQPGDVPAVLRPGVVRPRRRLAPDSRAVRAGCGRDLPDHLLAQPRTLGRARAGGRVRRRPARAQRPDPGPPGLVAALVVGGSCSCPPRSTTRSSCAWRRRTATTAGRAPPRPSSRPRSTAPRSWASA